MKNFDEILKYARSCGPKTIAVACAQDEEVILAVDNAKKLGIINAILVGDEEKSKYIMEELGISEDGYTFVNIIDVTEASRKAVQLVSSGEADIVMKGIVDTSIVLKAVLDKEIGLRSGKPLSHVAVFQIPKWDRLFYVTDTAMTLAPDLLGKKGIIENAVTVAHALGNDVPKVGIICAKEKVDVKMQATVDAKELEDMNVRGEITGCIVGGPFALDNAISEVAAKHKGMTHPLAGKCDILVAPYLEAGNMLYKSLVFFCESENAGIIVGAKAPIVLTSRADSDVAKLNSIALAVLCSAKSNGR
ncbi:MAG: phosphate butyryltransferase [Filifactoraceae bacterium]